MEDAIRMGHEISALKSSLTTAEAEIKKLQERMTTFEERFQERNIAVNNSLRKLKQ